MRLFFIPFLTTVQVISCVLPFRSTAQDQNKLNQIAKRWKTADDTTKSNLLNDLYWQFYQNEKTDSAYKIALYGLKYTSEINFPRGKASFLMSLGRQEQNKNDLIKAMQYYVKAGQIYDSIGFSKGYSISLSYQAKIFFYLRNYPLAIRLFDKAISILDPFTDSLNRYEKAESYLFKARIINHLKGATPEALLMLKKADSLYQKVGVISKGAAWAKLEIGMYFYQKKELDSSYANVSEAISLFQEKDSVEKTDGLLICCSLKSLIFLEKKDTAEAHSQALYALHVIRNIKTFHHDLVFPAKVIPEVLEKLGDYKNAYFFNKIYIKLNDSIYGNEVNASILDHLYDLELQKINTNNSLLIREQELMNKQLESHQLKENFTLFATLIFILLTILIFVFYRREQKKRKTLNEQKNVIEKQKEEIDHINSSLNTTIDELTKLSSNKTEIVRIVSHDLRAPLNRIIGISDLLKMDLEENESGKILLEKMVQEAKGGLILTEDLLNLALLEKNKVPVKTELCDLVDLVSRIVESYMPIAGEKNIGLSLNIKENKIMVSTDPRLYTRILDNFLSNAIKYSPHESKVEVMLKKSNEACLLGVKDTGPGISKDELELLFKPYQRLSNKPTGNESSTGLGLSIVKELSSYLQGEVWCESEKGKGSVFYFRLTL